MSTKSVFLIGPGFIGWNVLDLLVAEGYSVTALVRRKEQAEQIQASGAKVVFGGLDDAEVISREVRENEVRISGSFIEGEGDRGSRLGEWRGGPLQVGERGNTEFGRGERRAGALKD